MADEDIKIKDLPRTESVNDNDDVVIEDASPTTYRIHASDLRSYVAKSVQDSIDQMEKEITANTNAITENTNNIQTNKESISELNTNLAEVKDSLFEVQYGRTGVVSVAAGAVTEYDVTFPKAFSSTPQVFITCYSATTASTFGSNSWMVYDISTTGFMIRVANNESTGRSPGFNWLAIAG